MKREKLYLSTVDDKAHIVAQKYGLGLEFAEFCTAWNLDDEFQEVDASVREKMTCTDRYTLHGPFNELFPCAVDRLARKLAAYRFVQTVGVARDYGIRKIVLHGGFVPRLFFPVWFTERSAIFWKELLPEIPEDMVICVENVLENTPDMMGDFIRKVDDPRIRMTLDIGHAHAYSPVPVLDWISSCADIIDHYHIHNNDGTRDGHCALTDGTIPMVHVLEAVSTLTPRATVTLELPESESSVLWLKENKLLEDLL